MHTLKSKWRLLALLVPLGAVVALAAFVLGAGTFGGSASAAPGSPIDITGVSCSNVILTELNVAPGDSKQRLLGDSPPRVGVGELALFGNITLNSAISLNYTKHNGDNTTDGEGQVMNLNIPGIIAGQSRDVPLCAKVDKQVATVDSVTDEPGGAGVDDLAEVVVTAGANPPLKNMIVYWDSSTAARRGFYKITGVTGSTVNLEKTVTVCANPPANGTALGALHSCIPDNVKGAFADPPYAYNNSGTIKGGVLDPGTAPRVDGAEYTCQECEAPNFDKATLTSRSISCTPSTGPPENPSNPTGTWTRLEVLTVISANDPGNEKIASYGWSQFFTPVDPKTCANNANTQRSTTYNVVWSLDSAEREGATANFDSDWDKDGCLDYEEMNDPQPIGNGRDAYNPYDCDRNLEGVWSLTATETAISTSDGGNTIDPGSFYRCRVVMDHDKVTNALSARIYCYRDDPNVVVNPEAAPGVKGDGYSGGIFPLGESGLPPEPYGDVEEEHTVLTGSYAPGTDTISLSGCFKDLDGAGPEGVVYWATVSPGIDVQTGNGSIDIYKNQAADCVGSPSGSPVTTNVQIGLLAGKTYDTDWGPSFADYDFDLDGCSDRQELQDRGTGLPEGPNGPGKKGDARDPYNPYDFYDVDGDRIVTLQNDIVPVIGRFQTPAVNPNPNTGLSYAANYDRGGTLAGGAGSWNKKAADNIITLQDDILGVILQFGHTCA